MSKGATKAIAALRKGELPQKFDPAKTKQKLIKLEALADYARKIQEWQLLEDAIEAKIEEQIAFCDWWGREVTPTRTRGLNNSPVVPDLRPRVDDISEWKKRVHRWRNYLTDKKAYRARLLGAEYRAALLDGKTTYEDHENENDEMLTPAQYIEAAREVLGEIDLDPASRQEAQEIIKAKSYFTRADDGLNREWFGRVWLNPPYSDPLLENFIDKLIREITSGNIEAAILLTNSSTDTAWFHNAEAVAADICFTRGRVHFIDIVQGEKMPTRGQAFFYFGDERHKFESVFRQFGFVR